MALMSPELLVALTADADLVATGFVVGAGSGTVVPADLKYEQPDIAKAASRILERII